ncbi:MAG TPA: hypothetical protein VIL58_08060, partial [Thermoplasmata archaeon]
MPARGAMRAASSSGVTAIRVNRFSLRVSIPEVPTMRSAPSTEASRVSTVRADSRIPTPCIA